MNDAVDRPAGAVRPRRVTSAASAIAGLCALLALAGRTSGAGWLIVLLCIMAGSLIVGFGWPRLSLVGLKVSAAGPRDATAGQPAVVTMEVNRPGVGVMLRIGDGDWVGALSRGPISLPHTPTRRGALDVVEVQVVTGAPFGLSWQRRRLRVPLRHPVLVAPRTGDPNAPAHVARQDEGAVPTGAVAAGETLRSVRDYVVGDPLRLVHWPTSARRGELTVKELESPSRPQIHLAVVLHGDDDADEAATERAMGVVARALESGADVILDTHGPTGPSRVEVRTLVAAGRALAVAAPGHLPEPPLGSAPQRIEAGAR